MTLPRHIELAYVGIEVPDPATLAPFFGEVIGLVPGEPTDDGAVTWLPAAMSDGARPTVIRNSEGRARRDLARLYAGVCGTLVIDTADADLAGAVEAEGVRAVVTPTIMKGPEESAALARVVLGEVA